MSWPRRRISGQRNVGPASTSSWATSGVAGAQLPSRVSCRPVDRTHQQTHARTCGIRYDVTDVLIGVVGVCSGLAQELHDVPLIPKRRNEQARGTILLRSIYISVHPRTTLQRDLLHIQSEREETSEHMRRLAWAVHDVDVPAVRGHAEGHETQVALAPNINSNVRQERHYLCDNRKPVGARWNSSLSHAEKRQGPRSHVPARSELNLESHTPCLQITDQRGGEHRIRAFLI